MDNMPSSSSRTRGSIFGVAVTDALGAPAEFRKRGTFPRIDSYEKNFNFGTAPGTWTDDTSMTLCLAQSLIDDKGIFIPQTAIRHWVAWYQDGYLSATGRCFDIGNATRQALRIWSDYFRARPNLSTKDSKGHLEGQIVINNYLNRKSSSGNGALMRISPLPLVYHGNPSVLASSIPASSEPTHPYRLNASCCSLYCSLIASCFASPSPSKQELAASIPSLLSQIRTEDADLPNRFSLYNDLSAWERKKSAAISSSGYVLDTLEAALWAFFTTGSFREGAIEAVNLGDDADTVGAVYGGLAGAFYGFEAIPSEWIKDLVKRETVENIAQGLADVEAQICATL